MRSIPSRYAQIAGSGRRRIPADVLAVASVVMLSTSWVMARVAHPQGSLKGGVADTAFVLGFGGVGWLMARRLPSNPIGWCFSLGGLLWAFGGVYGGWAELAVTGHVPLGAFARWCAQLRIYGWLYAMPFSIQLPLLLLPDGRTVSRRWRAALWAVAMGVVLGTMGFATLPGVIDGTPQQLHLVNPLGVRFLGPLPQIAALAGAALLLVAMAAGVVAVVIRYRRSRGVERQQMRWVALGGCVLLSAPASALVPGVPAAVGGIVATVGIAAVPACVAVAVLRYRLYDLGRVVSRTLSYAVVTALLIAVYFGLVTSFARLLPGSSSLAVAASTLAAAALFQPLRRRVQTIVDQRFNRTRYDASLTVEAFSRRLRDEVELDAVRTDLLQVVDMTLQPITVGLWLRAAAP